MKYMSTRPQADQSNEIANCTWLEGETMNQAIHNDPITVGARGVRSLTEAADSSGSADVSAAFVIFNVAAVQDPEKMAAYRQRVPATIEAYGGRYLVRGGDLEVLEGSWAPTRLMIVEFPSVEQSKRWYDSDEYRPLREMRMTASDVEGVVVQGLTPAPTNAT